jgi:hypothetical protein
MVPGQAHKEATMSNRVTRIIAVAAAALLLAAVAPTLAFAKHGADNPPGDIRGGDGPGHR